jgi:hypothetical protein
VYSIDSGISLKPKALPKRKGSSPFFGTKISSYPLDLTHIFEAREGDGFAVAQGELRGETAALSRDGVSDSLAKSRPSIETSGSEAFAISIGNFQLFIACLPRVLMS